MTIEEPQVEGVTVEQYEVLDRRIRVQGVFDVVFTDHSDGIGADVTKHLESKIRVAIE